MPQKLLPNIGNEQNNDKQWQHFSLFLYKDALFIPSISMTSRAVSPAPSSSNTVTRPSSPVPHIRLRIPRDLYLVELAFAGSPYIWSLCDSIHAIYTLRRYELLLTDEETERVKARVKALSEEYRSSSSLSAVLCHHQTTMPHSSIPSDWHQTAGIHFFTLKNF